MGFLIGTEVEDFLSQQCYAMEKGGGMGLLCMGT
jgi:hypothetical protein